MVKDLLRKHSVSTVYFHLPLLSKEIYSELFFIKEAAEVGALAPGCLQVDCGHCGLRSEPFHWATLSKSLSESHCVTSAAAHLCSGWVPNASFCCFSVRSYI